METTMSAVGYRPQRQKRVKCKIYWPACNLEYLPTFEVGRGTDKEGVGCESCLALVTVCPWNTNGTRISNGNVVWACMLW